MKATLATLPKPSFPADGKLSLITGHLATARPIGLFPCPPSSVCLEGIWDDTFADMETQLGPPIGRDAHVRSVHDAGLAGRPVVGYVVKRDKDGQLWALDLSVVRHRRACFDRSLGDMWPEFASHPRTKKSKNELCFRLKRGS
jgi:hypothetical protein